MHRQRQGRASGPLNGFLCLGIVAALLGGMALDDRSERGIATGLAPIARITWSEVEVPVSPPATPEFRDRGRRIFEQRCALCHGLEGWGNGVSSAYLTTKPRDFTAAEFKLRSTTGFPSDEDLYRTITVGFPAYGMPTYGYLAPADRWALVHHVKQLGRAGRLTRQRREIMWDMIFDAGGSWPEELAVALDGAADEEVEVAENDELDDDDGYGEEDDDSGGGGLAGWSPLTTLEPNWTEALQAEYGEELKNVVLDVADSMDLVFDPGESRVYGGNFEATADSVARGGEVFVKWGCIACHGDTGRGDGPSSDTLRDSNGRPIQARDLTLSVWYFKGGQRSVDIARTLATGMPGTPMPSFDLGKDYRADLWHLAHFVQSLAGSSVEDGANRKGSRP